MKIESYLKLFAFILYTTAVVYSSVASGKVITLSAVTLDYAPYEYLKDGEAKGIAVDIIKEAVNRIEDVEVSFDFLPWSRAVHKLKAGEADVLFNAGVNDERKQWGNYGKNILIDQTYYLFKRTSSHFMVDPEITKTGELSIGIRLGYLYGSGVFRQAIDQGRFQRVELTKSTKMSIDMLLGGRIDTFVGDYLPTMDFIKKNRLEDLIDVVKNSEYPQQNLTVLTWPTYLLFNKKSVPLDIVDKIDAAMEEMRIDGTMDLIYANYAD